MKNRLITFLLICLTVVMLTACSGVPTAETATSPDLAATNAALMNVVAELVAQSTSQAAAINAAAETAAAVPADTQTPVIITATSQPTLPPTETALPADTPTAEITATLTEAEMEDYLLAKVKAANVLVYENPDAKLRLAPRLNRALTDFGFSGGQVVYAGNTLGTFEKLLRLQTWDLVILAVESRDTVKLGELGLHNQLYEYLNNGGALIVETWNLDEDDSALAGMLLTACEAHVEKDWHRVEEDPYDEFVIYTNPPDNTDIFSKPYAIKMPMLPTFFWEGDAGDFIRLDKGSSARILASVPSPDPNNYGLLTSCMDGRLLLQTFSSHDYPLFTSVRLWQNMMQYALINHFEAQQE